jgi:hypothetical protein
MLIVRHPEADEELDAAAVRYEELQQGLGDQFLDDFERTLAKVVSDPERWRKIRANNRKTNFRRFPYAIVYSFQAQTVYVKAVMHLRRRPNYWVKRG